MSGWIVRLSRPAPTVGEHRLSLDPAPIGHSWKVCAGRSRPGDCGVCSPAPFPNAQILLSSGSRLWRLAGRPRCPRLHEHGRLARSSVARCRCVEALDLLPDHYPDAQRTPCDESSSGPRAPGESSSSADGSWRCLGWARRRRVRTRAPHRTRYPANHFPIAGRRSISINPSPIPESHLAARAARATLTLKPRIP